MITLHAAWLEATLRLWGMGAAEPDGSNAALDPADPRANGPGVSADVLRSVVGDWSPDALLASVADEATVSFRHPAAVDHTGGSDRVIVTVPALVFSAADTIDLLVNMPSPMPRVCGDSVRYWALLARYVVSLLAQQQYVPDIEQRRDGSYAALWRPFVQTREELGWLERIAEVMPPVCREAAAERPAPSPGGGGAAAVHLVEGFIGAAVDAIIRRNVAQDTFFDRIHDRARQEQTGEVRWLSALMTDDPCIDGDPADIHPVAESIRTWVGRLEEGASPEPLRLCFTLREPAGVNDGPGTAAPTTGSPWRVDMHLALRDDPHQRFDIARLWSVESSRPTLLGRHLGHRRDQLRAELARAGEMCPLLDRVSASRPPEAVELTSMEAHTFIREWGPALHACGFGVTLPDWVSRPERRLGLQLFVRPIEAGPSSPRAALGLGSVMVFDWRVALGDVQLSLHEFERLAAEQTPLVRYRDAWLEIDAQAARTALDFMRARPAERLTLRDALRLAYGAEEVATGLPVVGLGGTDWIERFLGVASPDTVESLPQPGAFRGTLRPYQRRGLDWLAFLDSSNIGACLADDMGLGKTIQLIALLLHERERGEAVGPTLLFAPASVVGNWEREITRFARSLRVLVHHGPERRTGEGFVQAAAEHDVVITTYALGHRDLELLRRIDWHRLVLDEAQKVKNPQAAQTRAIRSLPALRLVALTGTPIENHLSELWSIMDILNPGLLGTAAQFRKHFVVPIEKLGKRGHATQLSRMLRPFILRRMKTDPGVICDLPEKMEMRVYCNLTPEQAGLYQRIVDETLGLIDAASGIRRRGLVLSMLTRLKQVCNHPAHLLRQDGPLEYRSGKCERLVEMLEEVIAEGDAALVFTQYRRMGHLLERVCAERLGTEPLFLHGGTPVAARDRMVQRFQDPAAGIRVFLLSLKAGGLGLNLTAANHVFHFDRWWNPAVEAQATDRAYRVGQTRRVQVHKFVCIGTVEDRIDGMLESKQALADHIVQSGDDWLTGLSTGELRECIRLSDEAVG